MSYARYSQSDKTSFVRLCETYRAVKATGLKTPEEKYAFIVLSLKVHAAKGRVPKRYWPLANR